MKAIINGIIAEFIDYTQNDLLFLRKMLTWEVTGKDEDSGELVEKTETLLTETNDKVTTLYGLAYALQNHRKFEIINNNEESIDEFKDILPDYLTNINLWDHQIEAVKAIVTMKRGIVDCPTGGGKCFAKGTPIMMFDGTIKNVENVVVGDLIMGDDSTPREVISLAYGIEEMFRITPKKGEPYEVNKSHILSLKSTNLGKTKKYEYLNDEKINGGKLFDIPLEKYLYLSEWKKSILKGYRVSVNFIKQPIDIDPYFLGVWLGDGRSNSQEICSEDNEIITYLNNYAKSLNLKVSKYNEPSKADGYSIVGISKKSNILLNMLRKHNLINNKHIPQCYVSNNRNIRLKVLAGILDTDGYLHPNNYFDLILESKKLFDNVVNLVQTLGFGTSKSIKKVKGKDYYRLHIFGNINEIPTLIKYKQASIRLQKKNVLITGIRVESIGDGEYFGFEIKGNNKRFLLGDCTVVHNTEVMIAALKYLFDNNKIKSALIVTPTKGLAEQFIERCTLRGFKREDLGLYYQNIKQTDRKIIVGVINSINLALTGKHGPDVGNILINKEALFLDEVHHLRALTFFNLVFQSKAKYLIGVSGSPFMNKDIFKDSGDALIYGIAGRVICKIPMRILYEKGLVAQPIVYYKRLPGRLLHHPANYQKLYSRLIVNNTRRNNLIVNWAKVFNSYGLTCLIMIQRLEHGKQLLLDLKSDRAICVFGGNKGYLYDNKMIEEFHINYDDFRSDFSKNVYDVVIGSQVLDEGFDLPSIGSVIFAGGGRSRRQNIQRLGRGLRRKTGLFNRVYILDFEDRDHVYMFSQFKARKEVMTDMEAIIPTKEEDFVMLLQKHYKSLTIGV